MSEPVVNVSPAQLISLIGEQYVELRITRELLSAARSEIEQLKKPKARKQKGTGHDPSASTK